MGDWDDGGGDWRRRFDDEQEDDGPLAGDDWAAEAEEEPKPAAPTKGAPKEESKPKPAAKDAKAADAKPKEEKAKGKAKDKAPAKAQPAVQPAQPAPQPKQKPIDPKLAKELAKKAQEDADLALAGDLFGTSTVSRATSEPSKEGGAGASVSSAAGAVALRVEDNKALFGDDQAAEDAVRAAARKEKQAQDEFALKSQGDMMRYGESVAARLLAADKNAQKFLVDFFRAVVRKAGPALKLEDCNALKQQVTVLCNEKAKDPAKKKKAGPAKPTARFQGGDEYTDSSHIDGDEYDFT